MTIKFDGTVLPAAQCPEMTAFPTAMKEIPYPAVDYIDEMDMGKRPRRFRVTGLLPGAKDANALNGGTTATVLIGLDTSKFGVLEDDVLGVSFPSCRPEASPRVFNFRMGVLNGEVMLLADYEIVLKQVRAT